MQYRGFVYALVSARPECRWVAALAWLALAGLATGCAVHRLPDRLPPAEAPRPEPLPAPPSTGPPADRDDAGTVHVVTEGQTLWRIAHVYGISADELARANGIVDPGQLAVGQPLFVPRATQPLVVPPYPEPLPPAGGPFASAPSDRTAGQLAWPLPDGEILSRFGDPRPNRRHAGIDIRGRAGEPVLAAEGGRVVFSGPTRGGYGNTVVLDHGDGLRTLYGHGSALLVRAGEWVERGQPIARVGRTGNATTEHCHFEIRRDGQAVDPLPYLVPALTAATDGQP